MKTGFEITPFDLSFSCRGLALRGKNHHGQRGEEVQVAEEIWMKLKQNNNLNQIEMGCFFTLGGLAGYEYSVKAGKRQRTLCNKDSVHNRIQVFFETFLSPWFGT